MTTTEHVLEERGQRKVIEDFIDDRLRRCWRAVWRRLPPASVAAVYEALGPDDGERVLLVTDHDKANRPSATTGQIGRLGRHVRLFLDFFNLDDHSAASVKATVAHEISHLVLGHLGAPEDTLGDIPALRVLAYAPRAKHQRYAAAELDEEDEADRQAAVWGFKHPRGRAIWRAGKRARTSEWTKRR